MWTCCQSADCCRLTGEVVMTHEERAEIERAVPPSIQLSWLPHTDSRFVRLSAGPCPLLDGTQCRVYEVRPFNCRRFGCFRNDVTTEPLQMVGVGLPLAVMATRENRRTYARMQRKGMRWARKHGWSEDMQ